MAAPPTSRATYVRRRVSASIIIAVLGALTIGMIFLAPFRDASGPGSASESTTVQGANLSTSSQTSAVASSAQPTMGAASAPDATSAPPSPSLRLTTFTDNCDTFPNRQPPVAELYEATFHVEGGSWTNPMIPYVAQSPPGVPAGIGISIDALFSRDDGKQTITQPAFLYQSYDRSLSGEHELLTPEGAPVWKVRFAFPAPGTWHLRLVAHDASGTAAYPTTDAVTIVAAPRMSHGFIHVSTSDRRYFVYDDGTTFNPAGFNEGFDRTRFTYDVDSTLAAWNGSGPNLLRLWMSSSGMIGSAWLPWRSMSLPYDGYLPATGLVADHPDGDIPFTFRVNDANRCMAYGISDSEALAIQAGHTYRLTLRVQTDGVTASTGGGFTVQLANYLGASCGTGAIQAPLIPFVSGSTGWQTLTTTFTLPDGVTPPPYLYLMLANASGNAYVSSVSLHDAAADAGSADLITRSPATLLGGFNLAAAWQWDYLLDHLQAQEITAKIVLLEKNDWVFNHLGRDGKPAADAPAGNTNFYAAPNTAVRAYQEYYWRIVLARWGAYRAVHSWELLNEGDPYSPDHIVLARDFARFMHGNDAASHPVTTSAWADFPLQLLQASGLDYADIHLYEDTSSPRPPWQLPAPATLDHSPADTDNGHGQSVRIPAGVSGDGDKAFIAIHGKGTWAIRVDVRADSLTGTCPYGAPPSLAGPQLVWRIDTGTYAGSQDRGTGIVPPAPTGQAFVCSSPAGTYGWQTVSGGFTLDDDLPHVLSIAFRSNFATGGTAWFDNLSITSPDGRPVSLFGNGTFDDSTSPTIDLAAGTIALGNRYGALSPSGAGMPLIRGETGLARGPSATEDPDLVRDKDGVWLHTLLWSQLAPGGAMNLPWYTTSINANQLWRSFAPYEAFLSDIPLASGGYTDAGATASDPRLRVIGQKNASTNRAYLWIYNSDFTWKQALSGTPPATVSGAVTFRLAPGTYRVAWWDTNTGVVQRVDTLTSADGRLSITLPGALQTDIAVKIAPA